MISALTVGRNIVRNPRIGSTGYTLGERDVYIRERWNACTKYIHMK